MFNLIYLTTCAMLVVQRTCFLQVATNLVSPTEVQTNYTIRAIFAMRYCAM